MNTIRSFVSRAAIVAASVAGVTPGLAVEKLDRGMVALRTGETSVYLSWRLLADDPAGRVFNVYRSTAGGGAMKLNDAPMSAGTNFARPVGVGNLSTNTTGCPGSPSCSHG